MPEVTVHKLLPGKRCDGQRTRSDAMCCLKGRLAVTTALLECSFQPPEPSPPPILICKALHHPQSMPGGLIFPPSADTSHFHQRLCSSGHAFSPLNTSNFWQGPVQASQPIIYPATKQLVCKCTAKSLQWCLSLWSLPGFSVHGVLQTRTLEWVAMPSSRGSSKPRDRTHISFVSCIGRHVLYYEHATWEAPINAK